MNLKTIDEHNHTTFIYQKVIISCHSFIPNFPTFDSYANEAKKDQPKLILQITADQLRGDMSYKYLDRMDKGGFNYLFNEGMRLSLLPQNLG